MNEPFVLTDELLVQALRKRTDVPMPSSLLSSVMAGATGMAQERARRRFHIPIPAIAGAAIAVAILVAVIAFRPVVNVPGTSPSAMPVSPSPTSVATLRASAGPGTPEPRPLGTSTGLRLSLGNDVAPIDVISAFDSIWIADIHANDVRRYDPATMRELARIPIQGGPAWFVDSGDALWVSLQNGSGLSRIDPATNTASAPVGGAPPCAAPFMLDGGIWQSACDGDQYLQIDPVARQVRTSYPAEGHGFLVHVGAGFYTSSHEGIARWENGTFTELANYTGPSDALAMSDGQTLWVVGGTAVLRIAPNDGHTLASFPYPGAIAVSFDDGGTGIGHAYITSSTGGVIVVDLETNEVVRTIPVAGAWVARADADGVIWVTDFNNSLLWRIAP